MSSYSTEKALAYLYPFVITMSTVCCITSGVAYAHWRYVLNACPESNCGCFLHAHTTFNSFEGGQISYCYFSTFGLLPVVLTAVIFGIYHVYRVCMGTAKRRTGTKTIHQRSGDIIVVTTESELRHNGISPYYWGPASVFSCVFFVYTLIYASIFTNGIDVTCKQYRESLLKEIQGVGNIVPVIKGRLSCPAIFDFMDYLVESISFERRRYGRINSGICFYMCLMCGWFAVIAWLIISVINLVSLRRTRAARV